MVKILNFSGRSVGTQMVITRLTANLLDTGTYRLTEGPDFVWGVSGIFPGTDRKGVLTASRGTFITGSWLCGGVDVADVQRFRDGSSL